jgi:heme/copper-type cytochrome/quinol oxidase subunit 2
MAVLVMFFVIAIGFAAVFVLVARRSHDEIDAERVRGTAYRLRKPWLIGLGVTLGAVLAALAFFIPYAAGGAQATTVRVVGGQFYWSLSTWCSRSRPPT